MKRWMLLLCLAVVLPAQAALDVFATVPEWGALASAIGGDRVRVFTATHGLQDPHRIEARPSLIARMRSARLVVATGAELEAGWLPLLLREAGNRAVQPGQSGFFEAAAQVSMRDVPAVVDRVHGDVHAAGNPHIHTDPRNLLPIGAALSERLASLDPEGAMHYRARWADFARRWQAAIAGWAAMAAPLSGVPVFVQHDAFSYLEAWLGLRRVGLLEATPGVEPGAAHLAAILAQHKTTPARLVLRPAYQAEAPSRWIVRRAEADGLARIVPVNLPFTVGGTPTAADLFTLFDETIALLLQGIGR